MVCDPVNTIFFWRSIFPSQFHFLLAVRRAFEKSPSTREDATFGCMKSYMLNEGVFKLQ